ncbi:hypothetical protein MKW92_004747 [Papaver armeniacum]|nr:hypothetical protein MKW92_004747 [Papaver armeniacum]
MASLNVPARIPSVSEDCQLLHKAFAGWGTDEDTIISILAHRTATQRKSIRKLYAETYGHDLFPPYQARFKKSLEEDVAAHITGDLRKLLVPLVSTYRYEGPEVDMTLAKDEAKILHEHISDKMYNHDEIIRILTTRSKIQLCATFNHYKDEFGTTITKDLKTDVEDDFLTPLRSAIKCLVTPVKYFEKVLRLAIKGVGTDEWALTRVVATRVEVDMNVIKEAYY